VIQKKYLRVFFSLFFHCDWEEEEKILFFFNCFFLSFHFQIVSTHIPRAKFLQSAKTSRRKEEEEEEEEEAKSRSRLPFLSSTRVETSGAVV
tara:strand:- start:665 stop:940 length:276 start_codon:yes stop_codon:yes gene_type:complete